MTTPFLLEPLLVSERPFEKAAQIVEKTLRSVPARDPKAPQMYLADQPLGLGDFLDSLCK